MVVIRLARFGNKHSPRYRISVADSRRSLGGKVIEVIGHYNPKPGGPEKEITLDMEKAKSWIQKGARPSDRVKSIMRRVEAQV